MRSYLKSVARSWKSEYKLISLIWTGRFPRPDKIPPLSVLERVFMTAILFLRSLSLVRLKDGFAAYGIGSALPEAYVVSWFIILLTLLFFPFASPLVCMLIAAYRILDGLNYRLCILFVDRYDRQWGLRSLNRSLILLILNYSELIVGFAIIYLHSGTIQRASNGTLETPIDALYFSLVTVTTLGYGDYVPTDTFGKWLVLIETFFGFILIVLVLGAFLTGNIGIRERPTEEDVPGPSAANVRVAHKKLTVVLADGRVLSVPLKWYSRLSKASIDQRNHWQLIDNGRGILWPDLNENISVGKLLAGNPSDKNQASLNH